METGLGWLGFGVGFVGCVAACMSARAETATEEEEEATPWPSVVLTFAIAVVLWAVAMQRREPFSTGQSMAWGFLIGGLAGALAGVLALCMRPGTACGRQMATLCMCFLGLSAVSLAYVFFHGCPEWAMLGVGSGVLMVGVIGLSVGPTSDQSRLVGAFAVFALVTTAALIFAVNHFDQPGQRNWWPVPLLLAATVGLAVFVGIVVNSVGKPGGRSAALCALVSSVVVIGLGAIYAAKIVSDWQFVYVICAGIGAAAISAWTATCAGRGEDDIPTHSGAVSAVLAVALVVVAFKLWAGLGVALGLLASFAVALPLVGLTVAREDETPTAANAVRGLVLFVASVVLFRLFIEYYRSDLGTTDLRIHYTFVGAILGALMPRVLSASRCGCGRGSWCAAACAGFLGLAAAGAPVVLLLIWGIKAVMGFVFGLTAALALRYADFPKESRAMRSESMLALAGQFSAIAFVWPMIEIEVTRVHKIEIMAGAIVLTVAWWLISDASSRRAAQ